MIVISYLLQLCSSVTTRGHPLTRKIKVGHNKLLPLLWCGWPGFVISLILVHLLFPPPIWITIPYLKMEKRYKNNNQLGFWDVVLQHKCLKKKCLLNITAGSVHYFYGFLFLGAATGRRGSGSGAAGFHLCFSQMMWSCWLLRARTSSMSWGGLQPYVKRLGWESAPPWTYKIPDTSCRNEFPPQGGGVLP